MASLTERFLESIEVAEDLPTLPPVLAALLRTLGRPDFSLDEVEDIVREDPVIVAQVLRAANAASVGARAAVASVSQALLRLGAERVRRVAMLASIYAAIPPRLSRQALDAFWRHSLGVGQTASVLARRAGLDDDAVELAFLAGILHDIALLVLQSHYPHEFLAAMRRAHEAGRPLPEAELALHGTEHGELGALIARHWSLPEALVQAIRAHHRLELAAPEHRRLATIVHLAEAAWTQAGEGDLGEAVEAPDEALCRAAAIDAAELPTLVAQARAEAAQSSVLG